ncbi:MAG: hypothetical protein AAFU77_07850 [Myxococcota bacterium]
MRFTGFLALATILVSSSAYAAEAEDAILVITGANIELSLSVSEVRDVFLKVRRQVRSSRLRPIGRSPGPVRTAFLKNALEMTDGEYSRYWVQKRFVSGDQPPPQASSAADVVSFVVKVKGGVGFVSRSELSPEQETKVRVVAEIESTP